MKSILKVKSFSDFVSKKKSEGMDINISESEDTPNKIISSKYACDCECCINVNIELLKKHLRKLRKSNASN